MTCQQSATFIVLLVLLFTLGVICPLYCPLPQLYYFFTLMKERYLAAETSVFLYNEKSYGWNSGIHSTAHTIRPTMTNSLRKYKLLY